MNVAKIMSKDVECLHRSDTIEYAAQLMEQHDIGSLPVCENELVVGIVTDRDIALRSVAQGQSPLQNVGDIMTRDPIVGKPEMDVREAAKIMADQQIRRLPIVEGSMLVGFVSLGDISVQPTLQDNAEWALKNISEPCDHI